LFRHQGFGIPEWQEFNIRRNICESQDGGIQSARERRAGDVGNVLCIGLESTSGFEGSLAASLSEIKVLEFYELLMIIMGSITLRFVFGLLGNVSLGKSMA
jgi:hypothetical protein